jgi:uncharacterized lipoprotein NlpE involved in copper resistance
MFGKVIPLTLLAIALTAMGCSVQQHGSNDSRNVKIETPVGGMKVKINNAVVVSDIGLPIYPGSTIVKKDTDVGAVDLDLSFHGFHIRAKGANYRTADSPEKVMAYYRKELAQYGEVIECRDKVAVGTPSKTSEGLSCDDNGFAVNETTKHPDVELKAGGKVHQHIVAIVKNSEETRFGLAALDFPNVENVGKESN